MRVGLWCLILAVLAAGCQPSKPSATRPSTTVDEKLPPEVTDDPASALPKGKR